MQTQQKALLSQSYMKSSISLKWTNLSVKPDAQFGLPCERSSHGLSILCGGSRLILHGGERVARTPLDKSQETWAADKSTLDDGEMWNWRLVSGHIGDDEAPPERVAHAQAVYNDSIVYIFGGRAGITMHERAMNDLWKLDCSGEPGSEKWSLVKPDLESGDKPPEIRSFHKMLCIGSNLYVFGGCAANHGRLADLFKYDILNNTWHNLGASTLLRGRGGANFISFDSEKNVGVVAGFCGEESNDGHLFDLASNKWKDKDLSSELEGLRPRSVCVASSFPSTKTSIIFGGEVDPSQKGHEGAGGFANDVVLLDESTSRYLESVPSPLTSDKDGSSSEWPQARGWSDGAGLDDGEGNGELYIFGGLTGDDANPIRLDDLWRLDISSNAPTFP